MVISRAYSNFVELHWPKYNYFDPGIKLEITIEKDIEPINYLDAVVLDHNLYYKEHKSHTRKIYRWCYTTEKGLRVV